MSVRVAVRVRPFNDREKELGSECCLDMKGDSTYLIDENGKSRTFNYEFLPKKNILVSQNISFCLQISFC